MNFEVKLKIGEIEVKVSDNAASDKELLEKLEFLSEIPKVGPNGNTDLKISVRQTKEGHTYYEIVDNKAKKRFQFGQSKTKAGKLFPKGWNDLYHYDESSNEDNSEEDSSEERDNEEVSEPIQKNTSVGLKKPSASVSSIAQKYSLKRG